MISSGDKTVKYDMLASTYNAVIMGTEMNIDRERFLSGFFSSSVMYVRASLNKTKNMNNELTKNKH